MIAKEKEFRNLRVTARDRIHFANFLNSPISEDFFAALFRYFDHRFTNPIQLDDESFGSWSLKLGHGHFSTQQIESASSPELSFSATVIFRDISSAYAGVLSFGSDLRLMSRDRAFFEMFYQFSKAICTKFKRDIPQIQEVELLQ